MTDMLREQAGRAQGLVGVDAVVERYTQYTALQRCVAPEEVAGLTRYLCSGSGGAISGGNLSVAGGSAFY